MLANNFFVKQINLLCKFGRKSSISYDTFGSVNFELQQTNSNLFNLMTLVYSYRFAFKLSGDLNVT